MRGIGGGGKKEKIGGRGNSEKRKDGMGERRERGIDRLSCCHLCFVSLSYSIVDVPANSCCPIHF